MLNRRAFLCTTISAAVAVPIAATAQKQVDKVHRIGVVSIGGPPTAAWDHLVQEMIESLQANGWEVGQNIAFEYRFDEGKRERLPELIAELLNLKPSVIVANSTPAALAAKKATATVPIVMVHVADPVRSGLVASLARPGGNVTGMTFLGPDFVFKQLEILRELLPHAAILGVLYDPLNSSHVDTLADAVSAAARAVSLKVHPIKAPATSRLDATFSEVIRSRVDVLLIFPLSLETGWDREAAELAIKNRVPTLGTFRTFAERGMLMSLAPSSEEQFRRAGAYVDRLLRGASAADLPVEQPTRFHLIVNLKTAKSLGLTIPPSLLLRADQVIE